jgi:hypothetical protein
MAFTATGTVEATTTSFNSGIITANGVALGEIADITVSSSRSSKPMYALNSFLARKLKAGNYAFTISFNGMSVSKTLNQIFFSSSSATSASDNTYTPIDAQQTTPTFMITCYTEGQETTAKGWQITVTNAICTKMDLNPKQEDYIGASYEFAATSITMHEIL